MSTCWNAREHTADEAEAIAKMGPGERANLPAKPCGKPATEWRLPNGRKGFYCAEHGPRVVARNQRLLDLKKGVS